MLNVLDSQILGIFHGLRTPYLDHFFASITWLGSLWLLVPLSALGILVVWRLGYAPVLSLHSTYLPAALLLASAAAFTLKAWFERPRPALFETLTAMPVDSAFPSAHSAQAAAFFVALWFLLPPALRVGGGIVLAGVVIAVMMSRLYLQVHWPSDVLVGTLLGIVCAVLLRVVFLPKVYA